MVSFISFQEGTIKLNMYKEPKTFFNKEICVLVEQSYDFLFAEELKLELNAFDSLNQFGEALVICSLGASSIVGSYCKSSIYVYMYRKFNEKGNTAIDILLLISTICQHFVCLFLTIFYSIGLGLDITYSDFFGETWCNIPWYVGVFGGAYRTFGSLGIAVYRLLLIKSNDWVKKVGQCKLISSLLALSIGISAACTIGFKTGNGPGSRKQVTWNWCVGRSEHFREVEHEYSLITGTVIDESELIAKLSLVGPLVGVMLELICYIFFFGHLYTHDRGLLKRKVLKEPEFKRRRRINAMSFTEQLYGFVFELLTYIGFLFTSQAGTRISYRLAIAIGFWVEFGIISMVEVTLSQNLRECLPHNLFSR